MVSTRRPLLGAKRDLRFHWMWRPVSLRMQQGGAETFGMRDRETALSLGFPHRAARY